MKQIISRRVVTLLINTLSGWTLREIDDLFKNASVRIVEEHESGFSGERRQRADKYISALDLSKPGDARKLLEVIQELMQAMELLGNSYSNESLAKFNSALKSDGYTFQNGLIISYGNAVSLNGLTAIAEAISADYIAHQAARLQAVVETDPEAAVGGSKELIESCCKTILSDHKIDGIESMDVPKLVKETQKVLKLTPEDVPETAGGKDTMKRLLGSLSTLAVSIAELRNLYGTGHGKDGRAKRPKVRHARLAVGAAVTFAMFMFETHVMQQEKARESTP